MTFEQFSDRYIELYQYFCPRQQPDENQILKYFKHLKQFGFNIFNVICDGIEESYSRDEFLKLNLAQYSREYLHKNKDKLEREIQSHFCFACGNQGWIIKNRITDKPVQVGDQDTYVKKCSCRKGQRLRELCSYGNNASFEECQEAAIANGGIFGEEIPF